MACWRCDATGARQGPAKLRGSFVRSSRAPLACRRTERGPAVHAAQPRAVAVCPYAFDHQPLWLWTDAACSDADAERDRFTLLHCFHECLALAPCYSCVGDVAAHGRIFAYDRPSCHSIAPEMFCRT